ncbi:MAG: Glycine--tRNA ligase beta subunit [Alphaproteobacteria bacterium MarineAlpha3_Bin4]|nr:MAG: Glycine--tRNA ligase beta subunit [Alphaproteobacteria bacterium MarineAlpha3_Bin4]
MTELLLEMLSEEIPARMQARAVEDLKRLVTEALNREDLTFECAKAYATPRRLVLVVDGIPETQPDVSEERRGPQVGAPEKAVDGFKNSLPADAEIEQREDKGNTYYFAIVEKKGIQVELLLGQLIIDIIRRFPWPKSMNWGVDHGPWIRPLHNIVCRFGPTASIAITLEPGRGFRTTETTGHKFLSPDWFEVKDFADYKKKLEKAKVIIDPAKRREIILKEAGKLCGKVGLVLKDDPELLDEIAGLVEWPVVLMGTIDDDLMYLPPEVLTTAMRHHQKYFACLDKGGNLANRFIVVANTETTDGGKQVIAGNERVLRARLADARFFWDQDRKQTLESRTNGLAGRVFHARLGSVLDKSKRIEALAAFVAEACGADAKQVKRAARLCKADHSTGMVGEFPELQGVMGRYYALSDGEPPEVADAIAEHYAPRGPNDACPEKPVSIALALNDKIDSLVGFFAIGEKPTGSKDPFALRRAALGVIRLILQNKLRLPLAATVFKAAYRLHEKQRGWEKEEETEGWLPVSSDLMAFFADRLKVYLRERGVRYDHVDAVFALGGEDDLVRLMARADALSEFLATEDGENLLTAYSRAANILKIEEKKDGRSYAKAPDPTLYCDGEEKVLVTAMASVVPEIDSAVSDERFSESMALLAALRKPVDDFFDAVTVNVDDPALRENRLKLLNKIRSALDDVADFSRIEG